MAWRKTKRITKKAKLAVIDFETDPFKYPRIPRPFAVEFLAEDGESFAAWGDDCADRLLSFLQSREQKYMIYAHNGGKFDFHFLHKEIENPVKVINSRIVSAKLFHHTLRDSYAILPVPLRDYEKDDFDYTKMERKVRKKHKAEIMTYLHHDCIYLLQLVTGFVEQFGRQLTIGSTAMKEIRKRYDFARLERKEDEIYRPFYFGGRVQCFKSGKIEGPVELYDVNSMYPFVMKSRLHPINGTFEHTDKMPKDFSRPFFLHFIGTNKGALPSVAKDGSLTFDKPRGEFMACSHELEIALKYGLVTIERVIDCHVAMQTITFDHYVDDFYQMKLAAEARGDKALRLFAKLLLNSGYGKFGQNPDNFADWYLNRDPGYEAELERQGYSMLCEYPDFDLWTRPAEDTEGAFFDVSVAASITSAARAVLLEGLIKATGRIYCDTDSIICKSFSGEKSETELGGWKLEKTTKHVAVAGRKLYAMYDTPGDDPKKKGDNCKLASKGGTLTIKDILNICSGKTVQFIKDSPTFSLKRNILDKRLTPTEQEKAFIHRKFRMTAIDMENELEDYFSSPD